MHSVMATQAAAMVVVMVAFLYSGFRNLRGEDEPIVYGYSATADEHRRKNLELIYNSTDAECVAMLRMARVHLHVMLLHLIGYQHCNGTFACHATT